MSYLTDLEKVKTVEELEALQQKQYAKKYNAQFHDDLGSVLQLLAFGIDEARHAASEGYDAEVELRIDF
jgi:hypothetical protein